MTHKEEQAATLILICITPFVILIASLFIHHKLYSSVPSSLSPTNMTGAGRIDYLPSTLDIQRELNRRNPKLKLEVDGVCGKLTQAAWDEECGHQFAKELLVVK